MVMADLGISIDEAALRDCCQTDRMGTTASNTVRCAQSHGLSAFAVKTASREQLSTWLIENSYPIVYVNLFPIDALWVTHAVVVEAITEKTVTYMDPVAGQRSVQISAFEQAWQMSHQQAIIIVGLDK